MFCTTNAVLKICLGGQNRMNRRKDIEMQNIDDVCQFSTEDLMEQTTGIIDLEEKR